MILLCSFTHSRYPPLTRSNTRAYIKEEHDTSPLTNAPLIHNGMLDKSIFPNYALKRVCIPCMKRPAPLGPYHRLATTARCSLEPIPRNRPLYRTAASIH
jgi:hypothetical protein